MQSWLFQLIPSHVHPLDESSSFSRTWATGKCNSHSGRHPYNFGCNFKECEIKLPPPSIFESSGRIKEAAAESNIPKWNILRSDNVWNKTKEHLCSAVSATLPHRSCLICVLQSIWFGIACLMMYIQEKTVWMKNTGSTEAAFALWIPSQCLFPQSSQVHRTNATPLTGKRGRKKNQIVNVWLTLRMTAWASHPLCTKTIIHANVQLKQDTHNTFFFPNSLFIPQAH